MTCAQINHRWRAEWPLLLAALNDATDRFVVSAMDNQRKQTEILQILDDMRKLVALKPSDLYTAIDIECKEVEQPWRDLWPEQEIFEG